MVLLIAPLFLVIAQAQPTASLESGVKTLIAESGAEVAVAFRTLDGRMETAHRRGQAVSRREHDESAGDNREPD
jgi:hypothetical protein